MTAFPSRILLAPEFLAASNTPGGTTTTLSSTTTTSLAWIFMAEEAATITQVGFKQSTMAGTPGVVRLSLQGADGSGAPDGSILASGNGYADYTPSSGNNGTLVWLTLSSPVTVTRGQMLCLYMIPVSGTWDGSNTLTVHRSMTNLASPNGLPYLRENGTKISVASLIFGYASASKSYGVPWQTGTTLNVGLNSTPDEVGVRFTLPAGLGSTYTIRGIEVFTSLAAGITLDMVLYSGTTPLQTRSAIDSDIGSSASPRVFKFLFSDTTLTPLSYGSEYVIALKFLAATTSAVQYMVVNRAQDWTAFQAAALAKWTQRTDGGAFSDTATQMPYIALLIDEVSPLQTLSRSPLARGKAA